MIKFTYRIFLLIFLCATYTMITGCNTKPSASLINQTIENFVKNETIETYAEIFEIRNAKKKNGYMLDDFYHLEISYDRYFLVGIEDAVSILGQRASKAEPDNLMGGLARGFFGLATSTGLLKISLAEQYGEFSQGDVSNEMASIRFINTDNGWQEYTTIDN